MTTATAPQSLLSATTRFAVAAAVATGFALVFMAATDASHDAVQIADGKLSAPYAAHVMLPRVDVVVKRANAPTRI